MLDLGDGGPPAVDEPEVVVLFLRLERCKDVLKWFLMALSGRPGRRRAISAHFGPNLE